MLLFISEDIIQYTLFGIISNFKTKSTKSKLFLTAIDRSLTIRQISLQ